MAKISGSYERIILGVSEQVPQERRSGQHYEQVNMISDAVRGLCRRHGSEHRDELFLTNYTELSDADTKLDIASYKSVEMLVGDVRYAVFYRCKPKPTNSIAPFAFCMSRETGDLVPVVIDTDDLCDALQANGASASVGVGRYLFFGANDFTPTITTTKLWDDEDNLRKAAAWVRTGAYSRKFKLKLVVRDTTTDVLTTFEAEYTTLAASYPNLLDTSDILASDPEYQKKVNDRVNEYNGLVTQWIGLAAADIVASNIATEVKDALDVLVAASAIPTVVLTTLSGSTIGIEVITGYEIEELKVSDSGDETLFRGIAHETSDPERLTAEHFPGKTVLVRPQGNRTTAGYYLTAKPRSSTFTGTGLTEVTWEESAGEKFEPQVVLALATVELGTLYISGSAAGLEVLQPTLAADPGVPRYSSNQVGDAESNPIPSFFGNKITYLGVFQDRLLVGSGSVLSFSKVGDYFNFFRKTVLSLANDDALEILSLGSEDDTIVSATFYDKNLVLFGKRKQYAINGRQTLTPNSPNIAVLSQHEDATDAYPQGSGNFVFYSKFRNGFSSLHQLQLGAVADSPESYETSQQLSRYLPGRPSQILAVTTPNVVLLKTEQSANGFFVYTYLDSAGGQERVFDSWSRWEWNPCLGNVVGMTFNAGDLYVLSVRFGRGTDDVVRWFAASDRMTFDTDLSSKPYMDGLRPFADVEANTTAFMNPNSEYSDDYRVAFDNTVPQFLMGQRYSMSDELEEAYPSIMGAAWVGIPSQGYVVPTNPYVRDRNGKARLDGRLVIVRYSVAVSETAGLDAFVETPGRGEFQVGQWTGIDIGRLSATLGVQPVASGVVTVPIGRANGEFTYKLQSRNWLPLAITSIEWTGQGYYNTRRA